MRALIYLRVSSEGQARKENPIETQRAACLEYAEKNGYEVDGSKDVYIDGGISGRTDSRKSFQDMMARVKTDNSFGAVIAYDMSRIFRNGIEYFKFKTDLEKAGKKFLSVTETLNGSTPSDWFLEWIMAGVAEFNSKHYGGKVKEGMKRKAEIGLYPGKAPYGYRNVQGEAYGGKEKRWMETDPTTSVWVRQIFAEYVQGRTSLQRLADDLNRRGCPTPTKKLWRTSSLEKILKKKTYIGWISWGGIDNPNGKHEKLVDEEVFYKVQALLKARNYGANKKRKYFFLLRGIAWCGECGSLITASKHTKKRTGKVYTYYHCSGQQHGRPVKCVQPVFTIKEGEDQIAALIKTIQIPESVADRLMGKIRKSAEANRKSSEDLRRSLTLQLENAQVRKKSLTDKYLDGNIDDETYRTHKSELENKEVQFNAELGDIEGKIEKAVEQMEKAINLAKDCYRTYKRANYDHKSLIAQTLFQKVVIEGKKITGAYLQEPFSFVCESKIAGRPEFKKEYKVTVNQS